MLTINNLLSFLILNSSCNRLPLWRTHHHHKFITLLLHSGLPFGCSPRTWGSSYHSSQNLSKSPHHKARGFCRVPCYELIPAVYILSFVCLLISLSRINLWYPQYALCPAFPTLSYFSSFIITPRYLKHFTLSTTWTPISICLISVVSFFAPSNTTWSSTYATIYKYL